MLKNALDWLARESPMGDVLPEKPAGVLGASSGPRGTRLVQASLRQVLHTCGALVMPAPTVFVANAASCFGADGALTDLVTAQSLQKLMLALERWMERVAPSHARPESVAATPG